MIETIGFILYLALCYVAGYMFGLCIAELINRHEWTHEVFTHV